jgi:DNA-binding XRE family transcriptional regulator
MPTGHQIAAARALAGATQDTIAAEAGIPRQTLARMEASGAGPVVRKNTQAAVLAALGSHGVMLLPNGVVLANASD